MIRKIGGEMRSTFCSNMVKSVMNELVFVLLLLSIFFTVKGYATTLLRKNLDNLITESKGIVMGTVHNVESHYSPDKEIYTFVTLKQLHIINGRYKQDTLVIRLYGGQVDDDVLKVFGSPRFEPEDRVLLFLRRNGYDIVPIVGWEQGIFRVTTDTVTEREEIRDYQGNRIIGIEGNKILKENSRSPEAHIIDRERSSETNTTTPSEVIQNNSQPGLRDQQPISVQAFIDALKEKIRQKKKRMGSIKSVEVLDFSNPFTHQAYAPKNSGWIPADLEQNKPVPPKPDKRKPIQQEKP